jgi:hypothetical protein
VVPDNLVYGTDGGDGWGRQDRLVEEVRDEV